MTAVILTLATLGGLIGMLIGVSLMREAQKFGPIVHPRQGFYAGILGWGGFLVMAAVVVPILMGMEVY